MNVKVAAKRTKELLKDNRFGGYNNKLDDLHIRWMLNKIITDTDMKNDKANRWLGWAQCAIVVGTHITLEDMKTANRNTECLSK